MCFFMSDKSKVLVAKRDIKVYKIGTYADDTSFNSFFYQEFEYPVNKIMFTKVKFRDAIDRGFHSFITCKIVSLNNDANVYVCTSLMYCLSLSAYTVYLGEFIIPKGATYCLNNYGEVVSNKLMYTGNHIEVTSDKIYNSKDLWNEK